MTKAKLVYNPGCITYRNTSDSVLESGTIVIVGKIFGVVAADTAPGCLAAVQIDGSYQIPKGAVAFTQGAEVCYLASSGEAVASGTSGAVSVGYAAADAAKEDSTVLVVLR